MTEKWQQALSRWDAWDKSVKEARARIEERYGDFAQLVSQAECEEHEVKEDSSGVEITITMNAQATTLWNLHDEIKKSASEFVLQQMGLPPSLLLHDRFVDYWMKSAFPEAYQEPEIDSETIAEANRRARSPV